MGGGARTSDIDGRVGRTSDIDGRVARTSDIDGRVAAINTTDDTAGVDYPVVTSDIIGIRVPDTGDTDVCRNSRGK